MKKITPPFVRNPYNYDTNAASDEAGLACPEPTLTQQQFAEESDINYIAERYGLTGELPQVLDLPSYGDFSGVFDFQTAQNAVVEANRKFMELPAKLRARFNNDPQQLLGFLDNEDNRAEAEFLGLVNKRPDPAPDAPQSPPGDAGAKGKGETPTPKPEAPAEPPKPSKKDT